MDRLDLDAYRIWEIAVKRKNMTLTEKNCKELADYKRKTGVSSSELVRRLLDEYFATQRRRSPYSRINGKEL